MLLRSLFVIFFVISYSVTANTDHSDGKSNSNQTTKILILGDSLSAGYGLKQDQAWVQLLQNAYNQEKSPISLINASISGETSGGALQRLPALLAEHTPDWVLVEIGGNDGLRGYPVKLLKQNLKQIVDKSIAANAKVLLMEIEITPNLGKRYATMFKDAYQQVANEKQLPIIPFFITSVVTDTNLMLPDGIHPNAEAQPLLSEKMKQHFDEIILQSE
ncbi:arylesterase [Pseudoalteromonas sp. G4]|uniref:arylesterase n=1 Tax=Pseudoalteromonas sp. G4 TaxID=2992761 RepID=UPI00237D9BE7|nr:arylesterase [Pseudoalteromonas sp. G4]MDE3273290.1 arylesterase [Pseudoalteromonas sp. G4]